MKLSGCNCCNWSSVRRRFAGRAAGDVHGRDVPGQPAAAALISAAVIRCGFMPCWNSAWLSSACFCSGHAAGGAVLHAVGHGLGGILLRGVVCAVCLLPPTLLMGATLPAISRWVETTPQGVSWLGFFYGGNIAGAVFGCLLAGFYLLRVHDMAIATYVGGGINVTVALLALVLAAHAPHTERRRSERISRRPPRRGR